MLLCVDVGTSSVKAGIIDAKGELVSWSREGLLFDTDRPKPFDLARRWLDAVRSVIARQSRIESIDGVVISGNGPTIVPVDNEGPSGPVLLWLDEKQIRMPGNPSFFLPKIVWFKHHHRELYEKTRWFISCPEFISYELTGTAVTITPNNEFKPFIWSEESAIAYDIDRDKLPPFVGLGDRIGVVGKSAAAEFGIPAGIPVLAGGSDFLMSLLGTATVRPGRTCDRAGTSEGINHCASTPVTSPRLRVLPHVIPGLFNVAGILASTGRIFEWFRRISGQQEKSYDRMLRDIESAPDGVDAPFFLPSLHDGETWEFAGAAFMNLEPYHGVSDMGRAVIESIAFSIRDLVETLERNDCAVSELRVSGGQARNHVWNQMKADMIGRDVVVPRIIDSELLGDAIVGYVGTGVHDNLVDTADTLYSEARRYKPSPAGRYEESYIRYCGVRERVLSASLPDPRRSTE